MTLRYTFAGLDRTSTYFLSPISDQSGNTNRCSSGGGTSPHPPSIDFFEGSDRTDTGSAPNRADYRVTYTVSNPDSDITSRTLELVDSTATVVDSVSPDQNSGTEVLSDRTGEGESYYVRLTVTDGTHTVSERLPSSGFDTADGTGTWLYP